MSDNKNTGEKLANSGTTLIKAGAYWTLFVVSVFALLVVGFCTMYLVSAQPKVHWDSHSSCGMIVAPSKERLTEVRTLCSVGLSKVGPNSIEEVLVNPHGALYVKIHPNLAAGFLAARRGSSAAVKARDQFAGAVAKGWSLVTGKNSVVTFQFRNGNDIGTASWADYSGNGQRRFYWVDPD